MTSTKATRSAASILRSRRWQTAIVASLMLTASPLALHAETSNAELAKEIAELKQQIRAMKGAITQTRVEVKKSSKVRTVAPAYAPPVIANIPPGATPVFATADKKLIFGSLVITPGGYVEAADAFRTRAQNRELESGATTIPFGPQAGISENRTSARGTRAALLIEAPITPSYLVSGYAEIDFQAVGTGSNYNQTSSFVPRARNLYATLDNSDYGFHVLAGQSFSLATLNTKGITPRNEALAPTLDYNYLSGFIYKRQAQIRIVKDFDKKLWLALSAENSGVTYQGCTAGPNGTPIGAGTGITSTCTFPGVGSLQGAIGGAATAAGTAPGTSGGGTAGDSALATNSFPDVIAKAAYEARFAERDIHGEVYGIYRDINDRAAYTIAGTNGLATNYNQSGYGIGFGVVAPIIPKKLDFQAAGLIGRGIMSYGASQLADSTFNANGSADPIRGQIFNGGLIYHATPSFDVYAFAGVETAQASFTGAGQVGGALLGYGLPNGNNSGCFNTVTLGTCNGNTKRVMEITGGVTDKLYKGAFGEVRVGLQYAYQQRELFQGNGATAAAAGVNAQPALPFSPKQNDQMVYTSLRYFPFQ